MPSPTPKPEAVDAALKGIERASTHPRELARQAVQRHRKPVTITQASIDSGYDHEERRRRFVGAAVAFRRRSFWSRLFWWR